MLSLFPAKRRLAEGSYDLVSLTDSEAEQQMPGSTAASVPSTMDPANIHKDGLLTAPSDGRWLRQAEANGRGNLVFIGYCPLFFDALQMRRRMVGGWVVFASCTVSTCFSFFFFTSY